MTTPLIFNRFLTRTRLKRAISHGYAGFLTDFVARELEERLEVISRSFEKSLDWGTPNGAALDVLTGSGKAGSVLRAAPVVGAGRVQLVADEELVPFQKDSFNLVVSLLALQHVNDLPGALAQIRWILQPDGLFLGCLLGGTTLQELRLSFMQGESEMTGGAHPRVAPFADIRDMGGLLQRAGFALPVVDAETVTVRYDHPLHLMQDLRSMGLANALEERSRKNLPRKVLARAMEIYQEQFSDKDGRIRATFELLWLSGWAPHDSQQKPLKPGSAKMSLAEALRVPETRTNAVTND
jgi:SAM-dependent methyltransferase